MSKNNKQNVIYCLIIASSEANSNAASDSDNSANTSNNIEATLTELLNPLKENIRLQTVANNPAAIIKCLLEHKTNILFISYAEQKNLSTYKKLLIRYSVDTLLITQADHFRQLSRDLSGLEIGSIPQIISKKESQSTAAFIKNLFTYSQLKKEFRNCKHLLSITDKRNRWLVNMTPEPIAYLYKGTHVHANPTYLSVFGFQSMAELKSTSINDLIPDKSKQMFQHFVQKQSLYADMKQTLLMTLNTIDGQHIRAAIRVAPAVLSKTRCMQLWVHKIEDDLNIPDAANPKNMATTPASPWVELSEKKTHLPAPESDIQIRKPAISKTNGFSELMKNMKPVKLKFQPLTSTHHSEINHYFVKLQFDAQEQQRINQKLKKSGSLKPAIFWDRLLVQKLTQQIADKRYAKKQLLLSLSGASLLDNSFIVFLIKHLELLPKEHPQIVFLIPHQANKQHHRRIKKIDQKLRSLKASLGIYNFVPDKLSIQRILNDKPAYVSFLPKWVKAISSRPEKLKEFTQLTEFLESRGIETILS